MRTRLPVGHSLVAVGFTCGAERTQADELNERHGNGSGVISTIDGC